MDGLPTEEHLRALADTYDEQSRDTYLSLYADLRHRDYKDALETRAEAIRDALDDDEARETFDAAFQRALGQLPELKGKGAEGAAVFVSETHGFLQTHPLPEPLPPRLVLDSSPYLRPLARYLHDHQDHLLVLLDGQHATIHHVQAGAPTEVGRSDVDPIGRHKKGGMSQRRYQRHRENIVQHHLDEIVEQLERLLQETSAQRIILAGPGDAKKHLLDRLGTHARDLVIAVEDAELDDPHIHDELREILETDAADEARANLERIHAALNQNDLVAIGPYEVARAARDGRIDLLLIRQGHVAGARKCEAHQEFHPTDTTCEACGNPGTEVDLINEAIEGATRTETTIDFIPKQTTDKLLDRAGVLALLRW